MNGNYFSGKANLLNIIGSLFLATSLITTVLVIRNPQIFSSQARYSPDALIRQRERQGGCKGAACLAPEIINNREKNQTGVAKEILDLYDKAVAGDANALAELKTKNESLANQVESQLAQVSKTSTTVTTEQSSGNVNDICIQDGGHFENGVCVYGSTGTVTNTVSTNQTTSTTTSSRCTITTCSQGTKLLKYSDGSCKCIPISAPPPVTTAPIVSNTSVNYSCPANYTVAQNQYSVFYCKEDTSVSSTLKKDGSFCSDSNECASGDCGVTFLGLKTCHQPTAKPSIELAAQLATFKPIGTTCDKSAQCGTGNCASSWTSPDGSKTFSTKGNVCTWTDAEQNAFKNAQSVRETEVITKTAEGLAVASSGVKIFNALGQITKIASLGGEATIGQTIANLPSASQIFLGQTLSSLPAYAAPLITIGSTAPFAINQSTQCSQYGFDSSQCQAANDQAIYAAAGLQQIMDIQLAEAISAAKTTATAPIAQSEMLFGPQVNELSSAKLTGDILLADTKTTANNLLFGNPIPTSLEITEQTVLSPIEKSLIQVDNVYGQLQATKNYLSRGSISDILNPSELSPLGITDITSESAGGFSISQAEDGTVRLLPLSGNPAVKNLDALSKDLASVINEDIPNIIFERPLGSSEITLKINGTTYPATSVTDAARTIENVTGRAVTIDEATGVISFEPPISKLPASVEKFINKDPVGWGKAVINEHLVTARTNDGLVEEQILRKIEPYLKPEVLDEHYLALSTDQRLQYIDDNFGVLGSKATDLFNPDAIEKFGRTEILNNQATRQFTRSEFLDLSLEDHLQVQKAVSLVPEIDSVTLTIQSDGNPVWSVLYKGEENVIRTGSTKLPFNEIERRINELPPIVPKTTMVDVGNGRVIILTQKIEGNFANNLQDETKIISIVGELSKLGFEPDFIPGGTINMTNFIVSSDGTIYYVDGDVFDHLLTSQDFVQSKTATDKVNQDIEKFLEFNQQERGEEQISKTPTFLEKVQGWYTQNIKPKLPSFLGGEANVPILELPTKSVPETITPSIQLPKTREEQISYLTQKVQESIRTDAQTTSGIGKPIVLNIPKPNTVRVYRGIVTQDAESILDEVPNMMRLIPEGSGETSVFPIISDQSFRNLVNELADSPTEANFLKVLRAAPESIKPELTATLSQVRELQLKQGWDFETAIIYIHHDTIRGLVGTSPYVSATKNIRVAYGYAGDNGGIIVIDINPSRLVRVTSDGEEVAIRGLLDESEITGVIPININPNFSSPRTTASDLNIAVQSLNKDLESVEPLTSSISPFVEEETVPIAIGKPVTDLPESNIKKQISQAISEGRRSILYDDRGASLLLDTKLAEGGQSVIYTATDTTGSLVVVKIPSNTASQQAIDSEFELIQKLRQALIAEDRVDLLDHIISPISKVSIEKGGATVDGYAMPYLDGVTLSEYLKSGNKGLAEADIQTFREMAQIWDKRGLSFGDLYPTNIVKQNGKWVLFDPAPVELTGPTGLSRNIPLRDGKIPSYFINPEDTVVIHGDQNLALYGIDLNNERALDNMIETFGIGPTAASSQISPTLTFADNFANFVSTPNGKKFMSGITLVTGFGGANIINNTFNFIGTFLPNSFKTILNFFNQMPKSSVNPSSNSLSALPAAPDIYASRPSGLTLKPGKCQLNKTTGSYCDGERMYQLYSWYKDQKGAWWYNATGGTFTPFDFMAIMLVGEETGGTPETLRAVSLAAANQLWYSLPEDKRREAYCGTPNCEAGVFNFLGAYSQSAVERYNTLFPNDSATPVGGTSKENLLSGNDKIWADKFANSAASLTLDQIANLLESPTAQSQEYINLPTDWGCLGCGDSATRWVARANQCNAKIGTTDRCGIYYQGDGEVVYTLNQKASWENGSCDYLCHH